MKELCRKCMKCGKSPAFDSSIKLYRFPRPGKTNILRCESWAKICFPQDAWSSVEFQAKLFAEHKMLCNENFEESSFIDCISKRLHRFACPSIRRTQAGAGTSNVSSDKNENETAVSDHSKNETAENDHSKNQTAVSDHSKNQTAVSDHSKNQTAVSDHSENQTVLRDHSKNQTAVSDHSESQPAVNINVEDSVDDSQYLAGVHPLTGIDDDCYNISDDDCQAVDDDSSFYHNVSKRSDDKDDIEMEPHNLDKNEDLHEGFKCNFCSGDIKGYRYTCVQCPDYDLCGSCEARGAHCLHYVLRIPRPKPYTEIQPLLREIRRLLSGADTDELWTPPDEIKEEESDDEVVMNDDDPLDITCVTPTLSETEDNVPEISSLTIITKSHGNRQDNNDTVPQVTMQPRLTSHLLNPLQTYTRHKKTVTVDTRSAASTSSPYPASTRLTASNKNTLSTRPQAIDNTRTSASESSQYTASPRLAAEGNTILTTESSPQVIDKTRTPVSASSLHPVLPRLAPQRNERPLLTFESSLQAIDNTRTTASKSSLFTASTSVSSVGNTVLTLATNVEDTDSTSRPVPATSTLHAAASITPGDTDTIYNKINITGDSRLQVPMATKRKYSENIEASKRTPGILLKGSKKLIVVPSISKVIGPETRFKIIKKPSATGQPQAQGAVSAARHRTRSTRRDQLAVGAAHVEKVQFDGQVISLKNRQHMKKDPVQADDDVIENIVI